MLTPEQYTEIADSATHNYEELEAFIIDDFVRRVSTAGTITETARYQYERAKLLGMSTEAIKQKTKETMQVSDSEIDRLFNAWGLQALKTENELAKKAGLSPITIHQKPELKHIINAGARQTKGKMKNITGTMGIARRENGQLVFTGLDDALVKEMDYVQWQVASGVLSPTEAVRQSVNRLADSGIRTVDCPSGWSNHLDVAARRATVTGINQMSGQLTDLLGKEMGCNHVEVTAHAGARTTGDGIYNHAKWQGKVYQRVGASEEYPNLYKATGLGTGPGLKGWNCRHDYNNFWPGISERTWSDEELKNIDPPPVTIEGKTYTYYEANQRQRAIERAIRRTKRELIGHHASGDQEAFTAASIKLQRQKEAYKKFSKAAGLKLKSDRLQAHGFGKGISRKQLNASKKPVEKTVYGKVGLRSGGNDDKIYKTAKGIKETIPGL